MRRLEPPATATWLLEHFTFGERNEALAGDLLEDFRNGRTAVRLASWFGPFRHFVLAHTWDVEGLGNIYPVVVAAVGMWESL